MVGSPVVNFPSPDIWSHPGIPLSQHLLETMDNIDYILSGITIPDIPGINLDSSSNSKIMKLVGSLHDLGKATSYFQKYIRSSGNEQKQLKLLPETNHSRIGALYALYTVAFTDLFSQIPKHDRDLLAQCVYIAIARHHGNLKNIHLERADLRNQINEIRDKGIGYNQIEQIDPNKMNPILSEIGKAIGANLPTWEEFSKGILSDHVKKRIRNYQRLVRGLKAICEDRWHKKHSKKVVDIAEYIGFLTHFYYSLLQDADKTSAMRQQPIQRVQIHLFGELIRHYENKFNIDIDTVRTPADPLTLSNGRSSIFKEAVTAAESFDLDHHIQVLEAPTGSGKTYTNAGWAMKLRQRLQEKTGKPYRIIYLLPFLSIIEQNHEVLSEVFETGSTRVGSNLLLKHHYLSDVSFSIESKMDDFNPNEELFFLEGWNAEIIVSTFHQFFHSMITNRKKSLRKYNKYANAIFILDEIQAFPIKYWKIFDKMLHRFLKFMGSYLLFSTATMPGILSQPPKSISQTGRALFDTIDRSEIHYRSKPMQVDKLVAFLKNHQLLSPEENFLFVMNTKKSSVIVYKQLISDQVFVDSEIFYLSSNLLPVHRTLRLQQIKDAIDSDQHVILVSTQVIEAGVDLSFLTGFRDIAPFDSIIQAIGRINRHGKAHYPSRLTVVPLVDENDRELASYIYDHHLLSTTKSILSDTTPLSECDYRNTMTIYFKQVNSLKSGEAGKIIAEQYCKSEFSDLESGFDLINPQSYRVPVFVPLDDTAITLWNDYLDIRTMSDWKERNAKHVKLKPKLYQYIVNVNKNLVSKGDFEDHNWIYLLKSPLVSNYYDPDMGFVGPQDTPNHYIL